MIAIGLASKRKTKLANKTWKVVTSVSKLRPTEKDRLILECFAKPLAFFNAINRTKLIEKDDITKDVVLLSDGVRDDMNFGIKRIEKYCQQSAWLAILEILERKQQCKWYCNLCHKTISKEDKVLHLKDISHGCIWVTQNFKKHPKKGTGFVLEVLKSTCIRHLIRCFLYFSVSPFE